VPVLVLVLVPVPVLVLVTRARDSCPRPRRERRSPAERPAGKSTLIRRVDRAAALTEPPSGGNDKRLKENPTMFARAFAASALASAALLVGCESTSSTSNTPTTAAAAEVIPADVSMAADTQDAMEATDATGGMWNVYGPEDAFRGNDVVSIGALQGGESGIIVRGEITEVCAKKGCWMKLVEGDDEVFVKFKDYGFFVPRNAAGHRALLHGEAIKQITPVDELRHYAEDAGASPEAIAAITEPKTEITFMADGVRIAGDGLDAPFSAE
jgi:hypothetical protein